MSLTIATSPEIITPEVLQTPEVLVPAPKLVLRLTRHSILEPKAPHKDSSADDIAILQASAARQLAELRRIFGADVEIREVLTFGIPAGADPVVTLQEYVAVVGRAVDAIETVLPPALLQPILAAVAKKELPMVIRGSMSFGERRPEGQPPSIAEFKNYERLVKYDIIVEKM